MENGKLKIIGAARAEISLLNLCRVVTIIAEGNGKWKMENYRSSESRDKLACTMPRFPNCVRLSVAFRDDIAKGNERITSRL